MTIPTLALNDGYDIPQLGYGVFKVPAGTTPSAPSPRRSRSATATSTRPRSTATRRASARRSRASGIPRDELFVTTKLWNDRHDGDEPRAAIGESLEKLGLDQVDLYLVHWPTPARDNYVHAWEKLIELRDDGTDAQHRRLELPRAAPRAHRRRDGRDARGRPDRAAPDAPAARRDRRGRAEHGVLHRGVGSARSGQVRPRSRIPAVRDAADAHGKSPAQVVLRWHLQKGNIVFPKSVRVERLARTWTSSTSSSRMPRSTAIDALDPGDGSGRVSAHPDEVN